MSTIDEIRKLAEEDLLTFAKLVGPARMYGEIHEEIFKWWTRKDAGDHQLLLLPRDHQKSHCMAVRCAWEITRNPAVTIIYMSATANLAEKQLKAIKDILTSKTYQRYWPDMIHQDEGKRERWTVSEISVDHPKRALEGIRDPTVVAAGVTANITGLHCMIAALDDLVVPANAYTQEGRDKVIAAYSQLASVETTGSKEWVVGTRYYPKDLYKTLMDIKEDQFDDTGEPIGRENVYEVFERVVEEDGIFLWPRAARADGAWFGFNHKELARKKAKYLDIEQFYAQYYNNPNSLETDRINKSTFQYYNRRLLQNYEGRWYYNGDQLNIYAAIDFAFSLRKKADWTAIVVIGIDANRNVYVLDIERFRANQTLAYFEKIKTLHSKWEFRKIRAEVSVAQAVIVRDLKSEITRVGMRLSIDEHRPNRHQGKKEERISAVLDHRYENLSMYHMKGGLTELLEEELIMARPPHDDIKDSLASAVEIAMPPMRPRQLGASNETVIYHPRFGGVAA